MAVVTEVTVIEGSGVKGFSAEDGCVEDDSGNLSDELG
jgi:hypothetical protein